MKKLILFLFPIVTLAQLTPDATIKNNTDALIRTSVFVTRSNHALINDEITDSKLSRAEAYSSSGTNTYTATVSWVINYSSNFWVVINFTNVNTGSSTLNLNSLGAKSIVKNAAGTLVPVTGGDLFGVVWLYYNGTSFQLSSGTGSGIKYGSTSGTGTYAATITGVGGYSLGDIYAIKVNASNSGAATLNINSLGAVSLVSNGGNALSGNELQAGQIYILAYDGSNFQINNPPNANSTTAGQMLLFTGTGTFTTGTMDQNSITNALASNATALTTETNNEANAVFANVYNLTKKVFVRVMTTAALPANSYSGGVITATSFGALPAIDGVTLNGGDALIVNNEGGSSAHPNNGIYTVTNIGGVLSHFVLTRRSDSNTAGLINSAFAYVQQGSTNGIAFFYQSTTVVTLGTDGILYKTAELTTGASILYGNNSGGFSNVTIGSGLTFSGGTLSGSSGISGLTTNFIPYATSSSTIGDSELSKIGSGAYQISVSANGGDQFSMINSNTGSSASSGFSLTAGSTTGSLTAVSQNFTTIGANVIRLRNDIGNLYLNPVGGTLFIGTGAGAPFSSSTRVLNPFESNSSTNTVRFATRHTRATTGTPSIGIGSGIEFETQTGASTYKIGNTIESTSTNVTGSSEAFDLVFKSMDAGSAVAERFRMTSKGDFKTGHLVGNTSAPAIAAGTGAGTSPTISINGTDLAGYITVTTGTAPTLSATVVTITFNVAYGSSPTAIVIDPANSNAALLSGFTEPFVDQAGISTTTFAITAGTTALTGATTYKWYYHVIQ